MDPGEHPNPCLDDLESGWAGTRTGNGKLPPIWTPGKVRDSGTNLGILEISNSVP